MGQGGGRQGRFLLSSDGPKRPLRPRSIAARLFALRQMLGILVRQGHRPEAITGLGVVFDPIGRAGGILEWLYQRQQKHGEEEVLGGQLAQVAETMRQIGQHWLKLDEAACSQLAAWVSDAQAPRRAGLTPKNRERLRRLIQPRPYALLLNLPQELMQRARRAAAEQGEAREAGRLALLAVELEILLVFPMRLENLAGLRTDRHLHRLGAKGRRVTHIVLQPAETKNRKLIEWPLPAESAEFLEEYLYRFRPAIAAPENPFVFPGKDRHDRRSASALSQGLAQLIAREVGVEINLHLLRHFAAWLYLRRHPGRYGDVRNVLGHRSAATTEAFYVAFDEVAAAERFDATVLAERRATRATAAAAGLGSSRRGIRRCRRGATPAATASAPPVPPPLPAPEGGLP